LFIFAVGFLRKKKIKKISIENYFKKNIKKNILKISDLLKLTLESSILNNKLRKACFYPAIFSK